VLLDTFFAIEYNNESLELFNPIKDGSGSSISSKVFIDFTAMDLRAYFLIFYFIFSLAFTGSLYEKNLFF